MEATGVETKWVNSDRQLADSLTKPMCAHAMKELCNTGRWKIIFDEDFVSAKKVKRQVRDEAFKSPAPSNRGKDKGKGKSKGGKQKSKDRTTYYDIS